MAPFAGTAGAAPSPDADGVSNLATCYSVKKKLAVELVIDESLSLQDTDPDGARVELARAISEAMAQIAAVPLGADTGRIDLQVIGFGESVSVVIPWTEIDRRSADAVGDDLEAFRERDQQAATDYVDALTHAREDVLAHAAEMGRGNADSVCRAVFWFTDGQFDFKNGLSLRPSWAPDLDVRGDEAEILARGRALLCDGNGIADQFRSSETYLLTAALLSGGFEGGDESLLRSVTEGSDGCGALPGRPTGTYFSAADVRRLVTSIVPSVIGPPRPDEQRVECDPGSSTCTRSFGITPATVAVNLFIDAQPTGRLSLVGPAGDVVDLSPKASDGTVAGAEISSRAAGGTRLVTMDLSEASEAVVGDWVVRFEPDDFPASLSIWVSSRTGLSLVPVEPEPWTRGQEGSASFTLVDREGEPLAPGVVTSTDLKGRVTHGDEPSEPITLDFDPTTSQATLRFTPALDQPASSATINVLGTVTTSAGEVSALGASTKVRVKVANAPQAPESLDLGVVQARRQKERDEDKRQPVLPIEIEKTLTVVSAADGAGTFCLTDGSTVVVGDQAVVISPIGDACRRLEAGEEASIPVRVSIAEPDQGGTVDGYLAATTQSALSPEVYPVAIPVRGDIVVPPGDPYLDQGTFWKLLALSLLVPGGLWLGLSFVTSRFNKPSIIKAFCVPATIRPAASEFETPTMDAEDFDFLQPLSARSVTVEDLTITAPVRIFSTQDAIVERPGYLVHGPLGAGSRRTTLKGRIAHQIQGQWVFTVPEGTLVADPTSPLVGDLYFFVRDDAFALESEAGGLLDRSKQELSARLPDIIKRLQRSAPSPSPGGGGAGRAGGELGALGAGVSGAGSGGTTPPPTSTGQGGLM